jgi:hypothetical protein
MPPRLLELVREAYPDPQPFLTAEDFARAHHDDVRDLSDDELEDERLLARQRRALEARPGEWLRERIARLDAEAAGRKQRAAARR